ncbi:MAG: hypothetical protein KDB54_09360 [Solirubrobacterales bacterium]|nr:hypothetical protein [Solirubrobacterales bacterium]MCB0860845.1 hypothetical protein [Solirubrobacterales bacterium]HRV60339.1 nuclear transport factor 2 family protein [Solirubrobacterales bacterium]
MKLFAVTAIAFAVLGAAGCSGRDSGSGEDEAQITKVAQLYAQTAEDHDYAATCRLFTPDSLARIKQLKVFGSCEHLMKAGLGALSKEEIQKLDDLTDLQVDGDTATAQARGETINFEKVNGEWKLAIDTENES